MPFWGKICLDICLWTISVPRSSLSENCSLQGTDISKDKYLSIFLHQMEAIVFIILQIFFAKHAVLKIGIFPSFSWGIFGHVMGLDQSHGSKKIWWIIMANIQPSWPHAWSNKGFIIWLSGKFFCRDTDGGWS